MNNTLKDILMAVGILFIIIPMATIFVGVGFDSKIVGETPCVDGLNRINLEGIMCEDKIRTWFGYHEAFCLLVLIPSIFGLYLIYLGKHDALNNTSEGDGK